MMHSVLHCSEHEQSAHLRHHIHLGHSKPFIWQCYCYFISHYQAPSTNKSAFNKMDVKLVFSPYHCTSLNIARRHRLRITSYFTLLLLCNQSSLIIQLFSLLWFFFWIMVTLQYSRYFSARVFLLWYLFFPSIVLSDFYCCLNCHNVAASGYTFACQLLSTSAGHSARTGQSHVGGCPGNRCFWCHL